MVERINGRSQFENLILKIADSQKFITEKDKLSVLINKCSVYFDSELSEEELTYVAAAAKPILPEI